MLKTQLHFRNLNFLQIVFHQICMLSNVVFYQIVFHTHRSTPITFSLSFLRYSSKHCIATDFESLPLHTQYSEIHYVRDILYCPLSNNQQIKFSNLHL